MSSTPVTNSAFVFKINPDLSQIDWPYVCELFDKVNWRTRLPEEIEKAFKSSTWAIFVFQDEQLIAFGRTIDDGRYYAMLGDIVVDPDFQGRGLGKKIVSQLNGLLDNYHFVTLTAAPGKDAFYKSMGWKKQSTAYIWPQGPKQLRQHTEVEE
ncbi:GNAT family N-acetyltransferase [Pedobacter sp.]|uniref:GNAT family N-acetyltransferase n=1 Tax=Pedobacter sp. TaxID=1411316 RepID=UPI003D7FB851